MESGEGFARSVETASGVTVLAAIGRKCVGKVLFLEETERERECFCIVGCVAGNGNLL